MRILIINGPNLNLLGNREPTVYGNVSFREYFSTVVLKENIEIEYFQSNCEGEIIDALQQATCDGVVLNAGGYSHTSVALRDCISAISIPVVEVHISNIAARESFRHESLISAVCQGTIFGFGMKGYELAISSFCV